MSLHNMIPWNWGRKSLPVRKATDNQYQPSHSEYGSELQPYASFHNEINKVFDDFFRSFWTLDSSHFLSTSAFGADGEPMWSPQVDLVEHENEYRITAELPGLTENDVDVSVSKDAITIKGEKRQEKKENLKGYYRLERSYGSFYRSIPLPTDVDANRIDASFKNGVLELKLPKDDVQTGLRNIPVRQG